MQTIDLHAHTTASDGTLTPTELVVLAAHEGLTAVAVTDHDTLDGLPEAIEAARQMNIELVPGIELAIRTDTGRFHMVGLLIDPACPVLSSRLRTLKENRARRNERMVERLRELGLDISLDDVIEQSGGGQIGRPHMARALVAKGFVASMQQAFDEYLADGAKAHVPKDKIEADEGIALIHAAGGVAIVAHPDSLKLDDEALLAELRRLRKLGLDGLECYYSQHSPERTEALLQIAAAAGLLASGGSDFHGEVKPHVKLGHVDGDCPAPNALLVAMKEARSARRHHSP